MQRQFKLAIEEALGSNTADRALMRAKSATQRFPVSKWVEDLGILQDTAIRVHEEKKVRRHSKPWTSSSHRISGHFGGEKNSLIDAAPAQARDFLAGGLREDPVTGLSTGLNRCTSLGVPTGPVHCSRLVEEDPSLPPIMDVNNPQHKSFRALEGGVDNSSLREPDERHESGSRGRSMVSAAGIRYTRSLDGRERSNSPTEGDSLVRVDSGTHQRNSSSDSYKR